jgi:cytochrome c oxidase cbb3-type subunit 3
LNAHPRDLTSTQVADMSTEHLKEVIKNGLPGTTMSAWKSVLADEQIEAVIAYIERVFLR